MTVIHVGTCGFGMSQDDYFATYESLEVQKTFYQPPKPSTARRWRDKAPEDFIFTVKAWQVITHYPSSPTYRRCNISDEEKQQCGGFQTNDVVLEGWETTLEIADILDAPLVLCQCPASFDPTDEHKQNLRDFLEEVERGGRLVGWEPRGDWADDEVQALCEELDLVHVVDPFHDRQTHGEVNYFRMHGKTGYKYSYTEEDFAELTDHVTEETAYCMFNNVTMSEDARRFADYLDR
ncbi:MAG: DUF72 domain-containing protein [Planctomycetota bacterium]